MAAKLYFIGPNANDDSQERPLEVVTELKCYFSIDDLKNDFMYSRIAGVLNEIVDSDTFDWDFYYSDANDGSKSEAQTYGIFECELKNGNKLKFVKDIVLLSKYPWIN